MQDLNRRSAITLGLTVATAAPFAVLPTLAASETYAADVGKEIMPGIRQVELGEWPVKLGGYTKVVVNDYLFAPGAAFPAESMKNDMLCQIMEGEISTTQDGKMFTSTAGKAYSCVTGMVAGDKNASSAPAIMRVIDLLTA